MPTRNSWTRNQLLVAFRLYCQIPFGKMHSKNPEIVKYANLIQRTPSALAMKLTNIASLDPFITATGRKGLDGASSADKLMWQEMQEDWNSFIENSQKAIEEFPNLKKTESISGSEITEEILDHSGEDKVGSVKIRIGQQFFRKSVLTAYNNQCCITGLAISKLLVASHIVPWRVDSKNRLNPRNGLCLSVLHDKAFDVGLITIAEDMTVKVSRKTSTVFGSFFKSAILSFDGKPILLPKKFTPNSEFLDYHRASIFEK